MGRRIVSDQLEAKADAAKIDDYFSKLLKYIPTEIVGGWIAITD